MSHVRPDVPFCVVQEKEKEIEVKNIYTQRMPKSVPRLLPRLPATCDAATMTDVPKPTAPRDSAPEGKPLPSSPAVPKRKVRKPSPMPAAPLDNNTHQSELQQKEAPPSDAVSTPNFKSEEPRPNSIGRVKGMPQSSTPHPLSNLKQAQPPEVSMVPSRTSSNPHSTAASSLASTPATTSVGSTKESIVEEESSKRVGLDFSSIRKTPGDVTPPAGDTVVTAGSLVSTQHPQLAQDGPKLSQDLAPLEDSRAKEDEERKNEQERKKALLLAKLQAIDEGGSAESVDSHLPSASKPDGNEAHSTGRPTPLEALSPQTPHFGLASVLQQGLDKAPQGTTGEVSNSNALQMEDNRVSKVVRRDTMTDFNGTDTAAKSKDGTPPSQPQRPFPTQTVAVSTFDSSVATETQLGGVASGKSLDKHQMTSSSGSLPQWPNTVQNMYRGKPALATADDPFGTRLSGRSNKSNPRLQEKGSPLHGVGSADALSEYKPKFSRRAQQKVAKRHTDKGISLSDDSRTQVTAMTHTERARPFKDSGGGLGASSLLDLHQPRQGAPNGPLGAASHDDHGYPWEMEVNLSSVAPGQTQPKPSNGLRFGQVDSAKRAKGGSASLLPHRKAKALQPAIDMSSMPGAIFDDDIEELSLT